MMKISHGHVSRDMYDRAQQLLCTTIGQFDDPNDKCSLNVHKVTCERELVSRLGRQQM
jgi:hypothetical protein